MWTYRRAAVVGLAAVGRPAAEAANRNDAAEHVADGAAVLARAGAAGLGDGAAAGNDLGHGLACDELSGGGGGGHGDGEDGDEAGELHFGGGGRLESLGKLELKR